MNFRKLNFVMDRLKVGEKVQQTILVVEDDEMLRDLIRLYLEKNNYNVIEAEDGEKAKEFFLRHQPCLIVLYLMLPKVSGEQFCHWIRNDLNNKIGKHTTKLKSRVQHVC